MDPRGIPMANRCWPSTRTSTTLSRTPGWHGGREERNCRRRSVEFEKNLYMAVQQCLATHRSRATAMGVSESRCDSSCISEDPQLRVPSSTGADDDDDTASSSSSSGLASPLAPAIPHASSCSLWRGRVLGWHCHSLILVPCVCCHPIVIVIVARSST
jgi:hypothetical protein